MNQPRSLAEILGVPEGYALEALLREKGASPSLADLNDPERAMRFLRTSLCGSYLFARYGVPQFAAGMFSVLPNFLPLDNEMGTMVRRIVEAVQGELFNNNIFGRPGECHAHFNDMLEAYAAAGGDLEEWEQFAEMDRAFGLDHAMEQSPLWRPGSARYGKNLRACADDPLATFIMMPANEILAPLVYARALASLPRNERFGKFRRFLEAHVELDEGDHGPAFLEWLDMCLTRADIWPDQRRAATRKIQTLFGG